MQECFGSRLLLWGTHKGVRYPYFSRTHPLSPIKIKLKQEIMGIADYESLSFLINLLIKWDISPFKSVKGYL